MQKEKNKGRNVQEVTVQIVVQEVLAINITIKEKYYILVEYVKRNILSTKLYDKERSLVPFPACCDNIVNIPKSNDSIKKGIFSISDFALIFLPL